MSLVEHHAKPAPFLAGGTVKAIIPQSFEEVYRLARIVVAAGMAPKGMDTEEKAAIAIMRGLEVGLTPFQALDKIAIVNGRPTIWGDGALGLVRGSGLCEWIKETTEGETAICEAKRRGDAQTIRRTFTVADAKKAGLWGKQGPWQQYPNRMLQMRARAFCLRDGFADVLGGLYLKEEFDGIEGQARDMTPTPPVPPPPPLTIAPDSATRKQLEASVAQIEAAKEPDWDGYRSSLRACVDQNEMNVVFDNAIVGRSEDEIEEFQHILTEEAARFWKDGE